MESAGGLAVEFPVLMGRKLDIALKDLSRTKPPPPPIKYLAIGLGGFFLFVIVVLPLLARVTADLRRRNKQT